MSDLRELLLALLAVTVVLYRVGKSAFSRTCGLKPRGRKCLEDGNLVEKNSESTG